VALTGQLPTSRYAYRSINQSNGPLFSFSFLVPSRELQLRAATGGEFVFPRRFATVLVFVALAGVGRGEFVFPRRFATVLVFVALAGVGRGPLDESSEELCIPSLFRLSFNKLGLGLSIPTVRTGIFFLGDAQTFCCP
jgi:hypothetical protein